MPVPVDPGGARAPHEDPTSPAIPRPSGRGRWASSPGSCRWPTASMPRPPGGCYQTVPIEPDQVLREMWENPKRGYDRVLVKALINLIGVYPVGTCVILDTFEVAVVAAPNPDGAAAQPPAGAHRGGRRRRPRSRRRATLVSLAEQDESGAYRRSIVKVTNPSRYRTHGRRLLCLSPGSRRPGPRLRADGRTALIPYLTAGYPTRRDQCRRAPGRRRGGRHHRGRRAVQRSTGRRAHHPALHLRGAAAGHDPGRHAGAHRRAELAARSCVQLPQSDPALRHRPLSRATPTRWASPGCSSPICRPGAIPRSSRPCRAAARSHSADRPDHAAERLAAAVEGAPGIRLSGGPARRHRCDRVACRRIWPTSIAAGAAGDSAAGGRGLRHLDAGAGAHRGGAWPMAWSSEARWWTSWGATASASGPRFFARFVRRSTGRLAMTINVQRLLDAL